ncbi:MAG: hypothetical protein NVSMB46_04750 [Candidatus Saccharimonadales bacterium]
MLNTLYFYRGFYILKLNITQGIYVLRKLFRSEYGFSTLEVGLMTIVVGIVGFVGWYIYQSNNNANSTYNNANNAIKSPIKSGISPIKTSDKTISTSQWKLYDGQFYTFKFPENWVNANGEVKTSDYQGAGVDPIVRGAKIVTAIQAPGSKYPIGNYCENTYDGSKYSGTHILIVDGVTAKQCDVIMGNGLTETVTYYSKKGYIYGPSVQYQAESKATYIDIYNKLLSTFQAYK